MRRILALAALLFSAAAVALVLAGPRDGTPSQAPARAGGADPAPAPEARDRRGDARRRAPRVRRARCPAGEAGCREVRGRIVLVEARDPDGDGDLHVVIAAGDVTAPGFTAVDVRAGLRPRRDPRVGDLAAAAGPVQTGSFGQSQIHALAFRTAAVG